MTTARRTEERPRSNAGLWWQRGRMPALLAGLVCLPVLAFAADTMGVRPENHVCAVLDADLRFPSKGTDTLCVYPTAMGICGMAVLLPATDLPRWVLVVERPNAAGGGRDTLVVGDSFGANFRTAHTVVRSFRVGRFSRHFYDAGLATQVADSELHRLAEDVPANPPRVEKVPSTKD